MSEMVERVAAVFAVELMELTADQRKGFVFPDDANGDTCEGARSAARRAIEAMAAPTNSMAVVYSDVLDPEEWFNIMPEDFWRAMINKALK